MASLISTTRGLLRTLVVTSLLLVALAPLRSRAGDVFASSEHMKTLARAERHLEAGLKTYVAKERERLKRIEQFISEARTIDPDRKNEKRHELVGNPLKALALIKRFLGPWQSALATVHNYDPWQELETQVLAVIRPYYPTPSDREGALLALARLQETYALPINDLIGGTIAGVASSAPLSQQTVVELGTLLLEVDIRDGGAGSRGVFSRSAASWLFAGMKHNVEPFTPPQDIYHGLGRAYALIGDYPSSLSYLQKAIKLDPKNQTYLRHILPGTSVPVDFHEAGWRIKYKKLCQQAAFDVRHYSILNKHPANASSNLQCSYKRTAFRPYGGYKMELLHHSPDVVLFHDVITDSESAILRELASADIERAKVGLVEGHGFISQVRVGKISWLHDAVPNATIGRVSQRIGDASGLDIEFPRSEPLQLSNYGLGGHYEPHFDYDENRFAPNYASELINTRGDRMATFMLYLNDVLLGGATAFPHLNLAIKPIKNAGVFWYNYRRSGVAERKSLHAGCPVIIGEKWVANKWIREFGQEFRHPCLLERNA